MLQYMMGQLYREKKTPSFYCLIEAVYSLITEFYPNQLQLEITALKMFWMQWFPAVVDLDKIPL